jgi:hypothetical protein
MDYLIKKPFAFILLTMFLLQSCENKITEKQEAIIMENNSVSVETNEGNPILFEDEKYGIKVEKIDSLEYFSQKANINYKRDEIKKVTDFGTAKNMLQNIVFFNDNQAVLKIRFRNGNENVYTNDYDYLYFAAYYPSEDILLTEGGHTVDISFNLKNGSETESTGNPDYIETSPNSLFRLNGYYGGQECSSYFIQEWENNEFTKIIQLDKEFEKQTKIWLCIMGDKFWKNDSELYFILADSYGENRRNLDFFKIEIIER